ncbi:hypothetical protein FNW52_07005 [Flavobacterium sp. ZT3R18]|uniref:hypothetical protein n=1 Tax=Flavobacterium sp. ZT3R18 TaxID=2594429 RepID=UPI00117A443E|nr:hypothetical protein [Flavobacterium sp. ZT3R18]TRX36982.1 hypothetical protein FNW52_07005 [Flavobacterium sp. ZT3R18]
MKEPFYQIELKTSGCSIELEINDIPFFGNYQEGGMAVDLPINNFILESGKQKITFIVLPLGNDKNIIHEATVEINIFVKEANMSYAEKTTIYTTKAPSFEHKSLPIFSFSNFFEAIVPYKLMGFKNSVSLEHESKVTILKALEFEQNKIIKILQTKDTEAYKIYHIDRLNDQYKSFYKSQEEIKEGEDSFFDGIPEKFKPIEFKDYKLEFYADYKLVALRKIKDSPGFVFVSENEKEYGFTEMAIYHRKTNGAPLTIIR